jgi:hypothetical protein
MWSFHGCRLPFDAARVALAMIHSMSALGTGSGLKTRIEWRELTASDTRMNDQLRLR